MKLEITEKNTGTGSAELSLKGELTIYSVSSLSEKLKSAVKRFQNIDINLTDVVKIDSAGFQILVSAFKSEKKLSLKKCGDEVTKIFSFYGEKI
jgi:anti-anti-sigma factor